MTCSRWAKIETMKHSMIAERAIKYQNLFF